MTYFINCIKNYANFKGRARRSESNFFILFAVLFSFGSIILNDIVWAFVPMPFRVLTVLYFVFMICPLISVLVRRAHDIGISGLWLLLYPGIIGLSFLTFLGPDLLKEVFKILLTFLPLVLNGALLVLLAMDGKKGENKYGPNPKEENLERV